MTTGDVAAWLRIAVVTLAAAGVDSPQLDAELLLAHCLGVERTRLWAQPAHDLTPDRAACLEAALRRRAAREPLAYILGERWFYGLALAVTPAVLVPRPETEQMVEAALAWLAERSGRPCAVADIGAGSGAIAIAVAVNTANAAPIFASDLSAGALAVAEANARRHGVDHRITLLHGDLLQALPQPVDLILANLPYVADTERNALMPEVRDHEPAAALFGGPDGLRDIARLLAQAHDYVKPGGALFLEIGWDHGPAALALAHTALPAAAISVLPDLAGHDRLLSIQTPS